MRRALCLLLALVLTLVPACGTSSENGNDGNLQPGFAKYILPFFPVGSGESLVFGFKNYATTEATIYLGGNAVGAGAYTIPARGEIRVAQGSLGVIPAGGFLSVDTRDVTNPDPVTGIPTPTATTGFVIPYQLRISGGSTMDASAGYGLGVPNVSTSLVPGSFETQIVNVSRTAAGGYTDVDFDIVFYDAFGTPISTQLDVTIPPNNSIEILPPVAPSGAAGHVEVTPSAQPQIAPADSLFRFGVAGLEDDPQVMIENRFLEVEESGSRQLGFTLRHGTDDFGNVYDFAMMLANYTSSDATVVIDAIRTTGGANIIPAPRIVTLDSKASKYLATTTVDSIGLDAGAAEQSPFSDILGLPTGKDLLDLYIFMNVPAGVDVSVREDNFTFKQFRRIIPGRTVMTTAMIPGVEVQTTTQGGIRNWVTVSNPTGGSKIVNISAFTPGGVEYVLTQQNVGGFQGVAWSPDGLIFTETPEDPNAVPVPYVAFRLSVQGGVIIDAYQERVNNPVFNLVENLRPHVVRNLSPR